MRCCTRTFLHSYSVCIFLVWRIKLNVQRWQMNKVTNWNVIRNTEWQLNFHTVQVSRRTREREEKKFNSIYLKYFVHCFYFFFSLSLFFRFFPSTWLYNCRLVFLFHLVHCNSSVSSSYKRKKERVDSGRSATRIQQEVERRKKYVHRQLTWLLSTWRGGKRGSKTSASVSIFTGDWRFPVEQRRQSGL